MKKALDSAKLKLDNYYETNKDLKEDSKEAYLVKTYFNWIEQKTDIISNEKDFSTPDGVDIKRGSVFWIEFGYNIDQELGGKHPGIILRTGGRTAIVLPLSTQEPSQAELDSGIYVEVDRVYGFKPMKRWVNVLNAMPVSIQRFDFSSKSGNVKGYVLDKIKDGMAKSGLWK